MEHTKGILLECNLSEEEINTIIEALSRDYVENDAEILEKEYQLQGKLREIISTFYTKIDAQKFTQMQVQSVKELNPMKYKELLEQLRELTRDQLELETLVFIRDKEKFVSLNNGLYFVTEFDEYEEDLETDQPYFRV